MSDMISISLTDEQKAQLDEFFEAVVAANKRDTAAAIGAQIYRDGMVVRLFLGNQAAALANALGSSGAYHSSASERKAKS